MSMLRTFNSSNLLAINSLDIPNLHFGIVVHSIYGFPQQEKHQPKSLGHPFLLSSMVYQLSEYLILDDMVRRCGAALL